MTTRGRLILSSVIGTAASAAYWWCFFAAAFVLTAGDYRPGAPQPSETMRSLTAIAVFVAGFAIYAVATWFWRKMDFRLAGRKDGIEYGP